MIQVQGLIQNQPVTLETGRLARQANGSVLLTTGNLVLLATATMSRDPRPDTDFLPLMVDFQEKAYAAGKIPGGFFKREAKPSTQATLTARLIDRALRPSFDPALTHDVHIVVTLLSYDQAIAPEPFAIIAASAALSISDIPFSTSIGAIQRTQDGLDTIIAGSADAIFMIEAAAQECDESVLIQAIADGHRQIQADLAIQTDLIAKAGKSKQVLAPPADTTDLAAAITARIQPVIAAAIAQGTDATLKTLDAEIHAAFPDEATPAVYAACKKQCIRTSMLTQKRRLDGRHFDEIRPIHADTGLLPAAHGSAVFTRGQTQSLGVLTLGSAQDAQVQDNLQDNTPDSRYMFHYNFPPFSVGETGFMGRIGRRELGHGDLAGRGIAAILPDLDQFPYTIRLVSEILESNGSSSMASVCSGCLALMDGGVPIKRPVAGIAMGLILGDDIGILSDIQGLEDHYGDMDFKVVRTEIGITALQLDIKVAGLSPEILNQALAQAKTGCLHILGRMTAQLAETRPDLYANAPRLTTLQVNPSKVGAIIGSGGSTIRKIEQASGASVAIDNDTPGRVTISAKTQAGLETAETMITDLTREAKVGDVYPKATVAKVAQFGAFVDLFPGCTGLLHVSNLGDKSVRPGDSIAVKVNRITRGDGGKSDKIDLILSE